MNKKKHHAPFLFATPTPSLPTLPRLGLLSVLLVGRYNNCIFVKKKNTLLKKSNNLFKQHHQKNIKKFKIRKKKFQKLSVRNEAEALHRPQVFAFTRKEPITVVTRTQKRKNPGIKKQTQHFFKKIQKKS
jgi:hypothetical protein